MSNALLGCAIGDALGVPFETKLPNYQPLVEWDGKTFLGSEHHGLKPGQFSDDTQLSIEVAQSLITNNGFYPEDLAQRYVEWMTSGRARGYGKTTLLAIHNLMQGVHYTESGVLGSYGNGTAMRAAPFGVYYRHDLKQLIEACRIDSAITHCSEEAEAGSIAIGVASALAVMGDTERLLDRIVEVIPDSQVKNKLNNGLPALLGAPNTDTDPSFALAWLGTKADVRETVPSSLYCFLKFDNYQEAVVAAIRAGGDTDTTASVVGALFGAKLGMQGIDRSLYTVEDFDQLVQLDSQLYNRSGEPLFTRSP